MTASITKNITILGFTNGSETVFFNANAETIAAHTNYVPQTTERGASYITVKNEDFDILSARMVARGYRFAILDN